MKVTKRFLCLLLVLCLTVGYMPQVVLAEAPDTVYLDPANGVDTNAGTEAAPVQTLEKAIGLLTEGGTVVFLSDLELTANTLLPAYGGPITFTSKTGAEGIRSAGSLRMGGDSTFQNITLTLTANSNTVYVAAEGHDLTIGQGVTTVANGTNKFHLTAGGRFANCTGNPVLTVQSGDWAFGYATHGYKITGDVTLNIEGDYISGFSTGYNGDITGNVTMNLSNFTGAINIENTHADGEVGGNVTVNLYDGAAPSTIAPSKGVVAGNITVNVLGDTTGAGTFTGTGANSALVLTEGTFDATVTDFGSVAVNVPGEKTLTLASSITADTVTCAGTLNFADAGSLTATAVTGTVNCTVTGEVLANKAYVIAPAASDIQFPAQTGVENMNGKWMYLDTENFKGIVVKAESDVKLVFYKDHDQQDVDIIQPDVTRTEDGYTYYYFSGRSGYFGYDASRSGDYTIYQRVYITAAERDAGFLEEVVMEKKANASINEWDYKYYYGQVDELIEITENDMTEKWHEEVPLVTPVFTDPDKPAHQMTTQPELETFISDLDEITPHMYVFSIGQSAKYKYEIPIVFFTKTDLSNCTTLEDVAAALEKDGLPNICYKAQMHGDEHAAGEGALNVIYQLCQEENKTLLDTINIYVMPRINPDGARECQRILRSESLLFSDVITAKTNIDPNRHMLTLAVHEARLYLRTVQLFNPVAELDGHERQRSSAVADIQIGGSYRYGSSTDMLDMQVDLMQTMFAALDAVDLSGAWYSDNVNTTPGNNTRSYAAAQSRIHILMETRGIYMGNECYGSRTASQVVSAMAYLKYCAENVTEMKAIVAAQQAQIVESGKTYEEEDTFIITGKTVAHPEHNLTTEKFNFAKGTVDENFTQAAKMYEPSRVRTMPTAYVIPKGLPKEAEILELMELQQIPYYELPANAAVSLQQTSGTVESQGRTTSNVTLSTEQVFTFPTGAYVMQMDHVNAYVLAMLMEPDHGGYDLVEQGRITQNIDGTFPIYRYIHDLVEGESIAYTIAAAAPTELSATNATVAGNDGVLSGLDADKLYEYKAAGDDAYTQLPAGTTEITGLSPNTYYIRYQADANGAVGLDATCVVGCTATVYLSAANGSDDNAGTAEATALKTLEAAYAKLSELFGSSGAASSGTIILVDDYTVASADTAVNLPTHAWPVTILGKTKSTKLIYDPGTTTVAKNQVFTFHGDTTLDHLTFHAASKDRYDYICAAGNKVVFGKDVTTTSARSTVYPILVGGGYDSTISGDVNLTVLGGTWYAIYATGFSASHYGTATLIVDGVTLKAGSIRSTYSGTRPGDTVIRLSNVKLTDNLYCGTYSTGKTSGDVTLILGENVTSAKTIYTGSKGAYNMEGTVTVVADGVDLSQVTLKNAAGSASGTVTKGVLCYASGDAVLVEGFDEYHIDTAKGGKVTLTEELTVNKIIGGGTVELAGNNLIGVPQAPTDDEDIAPDEVVEALAVEGVLGVSDTKTDDYNVSDGVYGLVTKITGLKGAEGYAKVSAEAGDSFHKVDTALTTVTLRPSVAGVYYTGSFTMDAVAAENVTTGMAVSLENEAPVVEENGTSLHTVGTTSALITNILTGAADDGIKAQKRIYARAYVQDSDGNIQYSQTVHVSLQQLAESIDAKLWGQLDDTQKEGLKAMYQNFAVVKDWKVDHLKDYVAQ